MARKRAKRKAIEAEHKKGQAEVSNTLDHLQESTNEAINSNIMVGEDYRSQALNNYHKILDLQEAVVLLKAEPMVLKKKYL